jgi:hypothetical protein
MRITRRMIIGGLAAVAAGVASIPLLRRSAFIDRHFRDVLAAGFGELPVSDGVIDRFISELRMHPTLPFVFEHPYRDGFADFLKYRLARPFGGQQRPDLKAIDELLLRHFLLSTNLITDPGVRTGERPVEFVRLWHGNLPCNNPFAELLPDPGG